VIIVKKIWSVLLIGVLFVSVLSEWQWVQASPSSLYTVNNKLTAIDQRVQSNLRILPAREKLTVIVILRQQADLSRVTGVENVQRLPGVIRALEGTANATQGPLKNLLIQRQSQGLVAQFKSLWIINGFSVTATSDVIDELAHYPDVLSIAPDDIRIVPADLGAPEANISLISAPDLWNMGLYGQGVVVANMDTGVDVSHPDLSSRWRGGSNSWFDPFGQHPATPTDLNGHGTWTMGIMVGGDAGGTTVGVAPAAQWIAVRIFNDQGGSTVTAIHQGYQWLLDPDGNPNSTDAPQVVNNSWAYANPGCYLDFEPDLQALRAAGILPVFAAGNGGPYPNTSYSPANNPSAFAVGATNNNDQIYAYSSRGPSTCGGSTGPFPEMVAPGVNIRTTDLLGGYYSDSGTSFAAPHVAGGLALLLSSNPNLSVADQESALTQSAVDLGAVGPDDVYGFGRLNLLAAFNWLDTAATATPLPPTATSTSTPTPTTTSTSIPATTLHIGDLDGSSTLSGSKWSATVTIYVHDANENLVPNATVYGVWSVKSQGKIFCVTNQDGYCQITFTGLNTRTSSIAFRVSRVDHTTLTYLSSSNHDADLTDSNGTTIIISKP
jgi:serine protease AprX